MQRFSRVLRLREGKEAEYERQHAAVWPDVLAAIGRSGLANMSIYRYGRWLFMYFELPDGMTLEEAGAIIDADESSRRWEQSMHELQEALPESEGLNWWVPMPEIFHWE